MDVGLQHVLSHSSKRSLCGNLEQLQRRPPTDARLLEFHDAWLFRDASGSLPDGCGWPIRPPITPIVSRSLSGLHAPGREGHSVLDRAGRVLFGSSCYATHWTRDGLRKLVRFKDPSRHGAVWRGAWRDSHCMLMVCEPIFVGCSFRPGPNVLFRVRRVIVLL